MADASAGVADIFRHAGAAYRDARALDAATLRIMAAIEKCRTPACGAHLYLCEGCGHRHVRYHSCRNRHCPQCQGAAARDWMEAQTASILPVPYFHIVFTLPPPVARIAFHNRKLVFDILFRAAAETLQTISADPARFAARVGGTAVLHTWNQRLQFHPHLHCVVPNAGFDIETGEWKVGSDRFFAPVKVLARHFRRRVLEEIEAAAGAGGLDLYGSIAHLRDPRAFRDLLRTARRTEWNVHARKPFAGPEAVIRYLSRYTHRVAIGNSRVLAFDGQSVSFRYRKPVTGSDRKPRYGVLTLDAHEFIRRFLLHRLPAGFHRIRHFGTLANGNRKKTVEAARNALCVPQPEPPPHTAPDHDDATPMPCPKCGHPMTLRIFSTLPETGQWEAPFAARDPPETTAP